MSSDEQGGHYGTLGSSFSRVFCRKDAFDLHCSALFAKTFTCRDGILYQWHVLMLKHSIIGQQNGSLSYKKNPASAMFKCSVKLHSVTNL